MADNEKNLRKIKWILFTMIIIQIIIIVVFGVLLVLGLENTENQEDQSAKTKMKVMKAATVVGLVISIGLDVMGLFGVFYEHYCLSLTYAILMSMSLGATMYKLNDGSVKGSDAWIGWVIYAFKFLLAALSFAYSTYIKRVYGKVKCCFCTC